MSALQRDGWPLEEAGAWPEDDGVQGGTNRAEPGTDWVRVGCRHCLQGSGTGSQQECHWGYGQVIFATNMLCHSWLDISDGLPKQLPHSREMLSTIGWGVKTQKRPSWRRHWTTLSSHAPATQSPCSSLASETATMTTSCWGQTESSSTLTLATWWATSSESILRGWVCCGNAVQCSSQRCSSR